MNKKIFSILTLFITFIYFLGCNLFMIFFGNKVKLIGISYVNSTYIILILACILLCHINFKKYDFKSNDSAKSFRKKMSEAVANSFAISTIVSTLVIILLFHFLENILEVLNFNQGIINYIIYATKIFFVTIPFLGLEITIYCYLYELECYSKVCKTLFLKVFIFFILTSILFFKYNTSSCFYAKIFTDLLFLFYFTKTCFEITIRKR